MKTNVFCVFAIVLICAGLVCSADKKTRDAYEKRWGPEIRAFEQMDAKNSFPDNAILFVGSSSIRMWDTARFFPTLKVINRGFGGSKTREVNYFFDRIVARYTPGTIAFYAGDNDIAGGYSPETVLEDFKTFYKLCTDKLPKTNIIYISIKPCNQRITFWPSMKKANELIEAYCKSKDNLQYMDMASCLLDKNGIPMDDLFKSDRLHLNDKGYEIWAKKLRAVLCN
jgi:lysophospholipase L1-like esterase